MKLQYIASACVLVEHGGVRVLCDPWLTDGIYGGAWYHNPPLQVEPEDVHGVEFIYVSHCHPDHFDVETFKRLNRHSIVLLGRYAHRFLAEQVKALGFHVVEVPHDRPFHLAGDLTIQIIPADDCDPVACGRLIGCPKLQTPQGTTAQLDTLAVFKGGDRVFVNVNDVPYAIAGPALDRVKAQYGKPDLLLVGYAGAGPWPQCFPDLTEEETKAAATEKQARFLKQAADFVNHLQPKRFLPFAGQYTLGGPLVDLNEKRGIPELHELAQWGGESMIRLPRNGWYDCETGVASPWVPEVPWRRKAYQESLRSRRLDHESDCWPSVEDIAGLIWKAEQAWQMRCQLRGFSTRWRLELDVGWPGHRDCIEVRCTPAIAEQERWVRIGVDARLLFRLLTRVFHWNNAEIGSLLTFSRYPDEYDAGFHYHLSFLHV